MTAIRDRQLILCLRSGDPAGDAAAAAAAAALQDKAVARGLASEVLTVPPDAPLPADSLGGLGSPSRLYLVGDGGRGPVALAALLAAAGLRSVGRISLVADAAAAPADASSDDSFAARLHGALRSAHGIETELAARTGEVTVVLDGEDRGRKRTRGAADALWDAKAPHSKVLYSWAHGRQHRRWATPD